MRGATFFIDKYQCSHKFQSTRPMRGATGIVLVLRPRHKVSIHAPHAGRDRRTHPSHPVDGSFNPRAPCGARPPFSHLSAIVDSFNPRAPCGARPFSLLIFHLMRTFQSTRPMRGATLRDPVRKYLIRCFNPRAPCGARQRSCVYSSAPESFQSTRPMRGATHADSFIKTRFGFQSTRPMRGATSEDFLCDLIDQVSIHAPHAGRDLLLVGRIRRPSHVSIHAPHAGRDIDTADTGYADMEFQSTRPMRGATCDRDDDGCYGGVSIHAPHAGRDSKRGHDFPPLPRIYGYSPPQIRVSRHLRPTPLLRHDSRTYIFTFCFLFTSPSHSVINAQMMMAASKS